jgi:hypothetical protein
VEAAALLAFRRGFLTGRPRRVRAKQRVASLDRDGAFLEVVEREAGEKRVGRKAIRVDHPPRCMAEMAIHRSEDRVDLCTGLRRDIVGMVRIPYVRVRGIGDNMTGEAAMLMLPSRRCPRYASAIAYAVSVAMIGGPASVAKLLTRPGCIVRRKRKLVAQGRPQLVHYVAASAAALAPSAAREMSARAQTLTS